MRNVVFLDIDGVLNFYDTKNRIGRINGVDPDKIEKLKEIVDYMNAEIVLTSSWKDFWSPELKNDGVNNWRGRSKKRYGRYLNIKLGEYGLEIKDKTYEEHWSLRCLGVLKYLDDNPDIDNYIILDDEPFRWRDYQLVNHWIDTDEPVRLTYCGEGLKEKHVKDAKERYDDGRLKNERKVNV